MPKSQNEKRAELIRVNISQAYAPGATESKDADDGSVFKDCISQVLRMYQHSDAKEVKEDFHCTLGDPDGAKNPEGQPYAKIVTGWKKMSLKKKEKIIFGDYWSYIDQIEAMYEAEITKAEVIEQACCDASYDEEE